MWAATGVVAGRRCADVDHWLGQVEGCSTPWQHSDLPVPVLQAAWQHINAARRVLAERLSLVDQDGRWLVDDDRLDALFADMVADADRVLDQHGQWRVDLPTFGGQEPDGTQGIWSWDERRVIRGTCAEDLAIVARADLL